MSTSIHHHIKGIRITLEMMPTLGFELPEELFEIPYVNETSGHGALSLHQELKFYDRLTTHFPDPFLALTLSPIYPAQLYGAMGYAMMSVKDLREFFDFVNEFSLLTLTLLNIFVIKGEETTTLKLSLRNINISKKLRNFFSDRDTASAFNVICTILGDPAPAHKIALVHDGHGNREKYFKFFGCDIVFDAPFNSITLLNNLLDKPAPYRDSRAFSVCVEECRRQLALIEKQDDIVGQVYQYFLQLPGYLHHIDTIASRLNMTERTLRRRLNEKSTTYQALQQSARFEMAKDYLLNTQLRLSEVAELVGYSETTNFTRAFKQWTDGLSPKEYRHKYGNS